jgi:hypothetical protein
LGFLQFVERLPPLKMDLQVLMATLLVVEVDQSTLI